jgi:hypothetical protein
VNARRDRSAAIETMDRTTIETMARTMIETVETMDRTMSRTIKTMDRTMIDPRPFISRRNSVQTIRTFALALAALATLASCDSAPPLASGEGPALPPDGLRYATAPFPAPANFTAQGPGLDPSSRSVTLTWEDVPGDEMYVVQWRTGERDVWKSLVSTGVNRTSYVTDSLSLAYSNDYRVAVLTSDFRTGAFSVVRLKPGAFTEPAIPLSDSLVSLTGYVRPNGGTATIWFELGTDPGLAGAAKTPSSPISSTTDPRRYIQSRTKVKPGLVYYYRLVASNAGGVSYGAIRSFTARHDQPAPPTSVSAVFSASPVPVPGGGVSAAHNVTVRWTHDGAGAAYFLVQRQQVGTSTWTWVGNFEPGQPAYHERRFVDQSVPVAADAEYDYRVSACRSWGNCDFSGPLARVAFKGLPAPAGFTATRAADGRVVLSWQDLPSNESYRLQWRAGETGTWQNVITAGKDVTTYTTDRVTAGMNNYYRIAGEVTLYRTGAYSETVLAAGAGRSLQVETGTASLLAPTSVRANGTVTPNGLAATAWIEWGTDPALATFSATPGQAAGSGVSPVAYYAMLTLPAAGKYYYRAAASNSVGTVRGAIQSFDTSPPPAPAFSASFDPSAFRVVMSWTHSGTPAPTQFRVERRRAGYEYWGELGVVPAGTTSFVDASLRVDSAWSFEYRVRACATSCGTSNAVLVNMPAMAAPAGFTATRTPDGQVALSWQDITGELAYLIQWRTDPAGPWKHVVSTGANRTSYTTASVTPGVTNYYRITGEASSYRRGPSSVTSIAVP